jgi:hypothetical protein
MCHIDSIDKDKEHPTCNCRVLLRPEGYRTLTYCAEGENLENKRAPNQYFLMKSHTCTSYRPTSKEQNVTKPVIVAKPEVHKNYEPKTSFALAATAAVSS